MAISSPLRFFKLDEFRHPELVANDAAVFLDTVRSVCGFALTLTSDARTPEENAAASGSSPTSWHLQGRAFDLRYPDSAEKVWKLTKAVFVCAADRGVELELVNSATDKHVHLAVFPPGDPRPSRLVIRAD